MRKKLIIRAIVATLLWLILIFTALVDFRTVVFVNKAQKKISNVATQSDVLENTNISNIAKAFVIEWATWNSDQNEYNKRLGMFIPNTTIDINVPDGVTQSVVSANIIDINKKGKNIYNVYLLVHAIRSIPSTDKNTGNTTYKTKDLFFEVNVPLKTENESAVITGLPLLVNKNIKTGQINDYKDFEQNNDSELATFITQFLQNYYSANDLTNFLDTNVSIKSIPGWKLESVNNLSVSKTKDKVYVNATISSDNIKITQNLCISITKRDNKFFVKSLQPEF